MKGSDGKIERYFVAPHFLLLIMLYMCPFETSLHRVLATLESIYK